MLDLNELMLFYAIVDQGSLSGAANKMGVPKSTISRKLGQLEERLGVRLLHRTTRVLQLTEAGQVYFERCKLMMEAVEDAEYAVSNLQSVPSGTLRLAMPMAFSTGIVGQMLGDFMATYSEVRVEVMATNAPVNLAADNIDAAFQVGPLPDSSNIARLVLEGERVLLAAPDYLERAGTPSTLEELQRFDTLQFSAYAWRWIIDGEFYKPELEHRLLANDVSIAKQMTLSGAGISILPLAMTYREIAAGELVPLLTEYTLEPTAIHLVYPERQQLPSKSRVFIDYVSAWAKKPKPWHSKDV